MENLCKLRHSAAVVFAYSLFKVVPDVRIVRSQEAVYGYSYDLKIPFQLQDEVLRAIEEKMKEIKNEAVPFTTTSMLSSNAYEYFQHLGQAALAQQALSSYEEHLPMVRLRDRLFWHQGPFAHSTEDIGYYKLALSESSRTSCRLSLLIAPDQSALRKVVKEYKSLGGKGHLELGEQRELFIPSPFVKERAFFWYPKGVALKKGLQNLLFQEKIVEVSAPLRSDVDVSLTVFQHMVLCTVQGADHRGLTQWVEHFSEGEEEGDGLFGAREYTRDFTLFLSNLANITKICFSSLQLIIKILKMLSFEFKVILSTGHSKQLTDSFRQSLVLGGWDFEEKPGSKSDPRIEFYVPDRYGRYWKHSTLETAPFNKGKEKTTGVATTFFVNLERTVALLLECHEGILPVVLEAVQVVLYVVHSNAERYAVQLEQKLKLAGVRVELLMTTKEELSSQLYKGLQEKVPFLAVVGEQERTTETVTVRERNTKEKQTMKVETLIDKLMSREVNH